MNPEGLLHHRKNYLGAGALLLASAPLALILPPRAGVPQALLQGGWGAILVGLGLALGTGRVSPRAAGWWAVLVGTQCAGALCLLMGDTTSVFFLSLLTFPFVTAVNAPGNRALTLGALGLSGSWALLLELLWHASASRVVGSALLWGAVAAVCLRGHSRFQRVRAEQRQLDSARIQALQKLALSERQRSRGSDQLVHLAKLDALTGLSNRLHFEEVLNHEWMRALRARRFISLVLADVDEFKQFNDSYGHLEGDGCLKAIAAALQGACRRPEDVVGRYGGEEFIAILPETNGVGALTVATRMREAVEGLRIAHRGSSVSPFATVSCGVAGFIPVEGVAPVALVKRADEALYQAKAKGRNCVIQLAMESDAPPLN